MFTKTLKFVAVVALALGAVGIANAGVITANMDFGDNVGGVYVGTAAAPDTGTVWNPGNVAGSYNSAANMIASDGVTSTGWSCTASTTVQSHLYKTPVPSGVIRMLNSNTYELGGWTITLGNLDNAKTYDLYLYAECGDGVTPGSGWGAQFEIAGQPTKVLDSTNCRSFVLNDNYVVYSGLTPVSNQIVVQVHGVLGESQDIGWVNGFQLQEVPEPASLILLGMGLLGLLAYAWRKRK